MIEKEVRDMLKNEVTRADLHELTPAAVQAVEMLGIENFVDLSYALGGVSIYVPKFESVIAPARNRMILKEFSGKNYMELALKYDISEVWVRQIVMQDKMKKNAISLFEETS